MKYVRQNTAEMDWTRLLPQILALKYSAETEARKRSEIDAVKREHAPCGDVIASLQEDMRKLGIQGCITVDLKARTCLFGTMISRCGRS